MSRGRGKGRREVEFVPAPASTAGRVPPHDLGAEAAVLSAIMLEGLPALDEVAEILKPEDFYSPANRRIFEAARALAEESVVPDAVTVGSWLQARERLAEIGGIPYLARITDSAPFVTNLSAYARTVRDTSKLRLLMGTCQKIAAEGYTDVGNIREFIDSAERQVFDIASESVGTSPTSTMGAVVREAFEDVQAAAKRGTTVTGLSTGFTALDQLLGGLHDGELVVIGARPGMGKTAFALNVAATVCAAEPHELDEYDRSSALFVSLEMPKKQIGLRGACAEGHVDVGKVRRGMLSQDDWERLTQASAWLASLDLFIDDAPGIGLFELRAKVRRVQSILAKAPPGPSGKPKRLGAIFVDYLQLMSDPDAASREEEIARISRGLKRLAKELSVPIVALAQLNRSVETRAGKDKRPNMSDLRESGAIEQDADAILFLYRDEYYNKDSLAKGIAEVIVAKQRNGPTGKVPLRFTSSCTRFDNLEIGSAPPPGMFDD